jgi:predicted GIY-YIG superfamily endonuclease
MHPQTIQIFLPDGNPTGIKVTEITNRIITAIMIPRSQLKDAEKRDEIKKHGIYFLFGELEDKVKPMIYIGETDDCFERIKSHNRNKDFWNYAVCFTSKTNSFTKSHVKYLEYLSIKNAIEIN